MKVDGVKTLTAPRDIVWDVLNEPSRMAGLLPGVESFEVEDETHWRANVKVPLGIGGLKMKIAFEKLEQQEPEFARLRAKGTGVGAILNMETVFHLSDAGADATDMRWEADVKIAGPVGSMGQRVLQPLINQQVGNVLSALEQQVHEAYEARTAAGGASGSGLLPGGGVTGPSVGSAGAPPPSLDAKAHTDPELKDSGPLPPANADADPSSVEGTSGAQLGINTLSPEAYEPNPEGPTQSTSDR